MTTIDQPIFLAKQVTIKVLRDYILDAGIADTDTILLNQIDFDELALEYRQTYQEHLPFPYLLVGVLVREDGRGLVPRGCTVLVENDTESLRVDPSDLFDPQRIIYRCHNCGTLVGLNGEELGPGQFRQDADYLNKFGKEVPVEYKRGECCNDAWKPETNRLSHPDQVDYSGIEGKPLKQLTEEDFRSIGLSKGTAADFDVIYTCKNTTRGKIYFTPNETSYSLRGYRLREIEKVFSTEQLITSLRDWLRK